MPRPNYEQVSTDRWAHTAIFFNAIHQGETFEIGPFSVTPVLADHGEHSPPGFRYLYHYNARQKDHLWMGLPLVT